MGTCMVTHTMGRVIDREEGFFMRSDAQKVIEVLSTTRDSMHELTLRQKTSQKYGEER